MISKLLNFCAWNVQGYNSQLVGNKFEDKEFLKIFEDMDFIGIRETHMHTEVLDKMSIPGFHRLETKNQIKNEKSNKAPKGIAVFVKETLKDMFKVEKLNKDDAIWVKIKKEKSGESKDIFVGTVYLNPSSKSSGADQKISKLADNIISLKEKGEVIIIGDLNARTGDLEDTMNPDKSDEMFDLSFPNPPPKRNSRDTKTDRRGLDLIELCKSADLQIANGRKMGDIFGDLTCIKYNGNSIVDYLITSSGIFKNIPCFKVGEFCRGCRITVLSSLHLKSDVWRKPPPKKIQTQKPLSNTHGQKKVKIIISRWSVVQSSK